MKKNKFILAQIQNANISILLFKIFIVILFILMCSDNSSAVEYSDSRGKDFWLTYIPNYHNNKNVTDLKLKFGDSLYIFISAEVPTTGLITYFDKNKKKYEQNFTITDPRQVYIFKVCNVNFELEGYNMSGLIGNGDYQCEKIAPQSFHVESNDDITVYAHNQANTTSESFLVLPYDAIGRSYFIMSYNSDGDYDNFPGSIAIGSTPSQFAIVATEDSTTVIIKPKCATRINGKNTQVVVLNRGDVYLVQADITQSNLRNDLTGTDVKSDKPIAVFSGHQRSSLPVETPRKTSSRDMLIEQMPCVATWGKNAYIVPYAQLSDMAPSGTDLYRIMAAFDDTEVYIDGVLVDIINSGEFIEGALLGPHEVKASTSILVAQFKKTAEDGTNNQGGYPNSDPFMMVIPPKEQFLNFYRFINVQSYEAGANGFYKKVYNYQYVNVITPDATKSGIRLDGKALNQNNFFKIGTSGYSYGNFLVTDGVHEIIGTGNFGILVYGYGPANSYGYVGGMSFKPLDFEKPKMTQNDTCFRISGFIHDSLLSDSHLDKVTVINGSEQNVKINLGQKQDNPSLIKFDAELVDINYDGKFIITAIDSSELKSTFNIDIPGFTVAFKDVVGKDSIINVKKYFRVNKNNQISFSLLNYGNFPQRIEGLKSSNNNISNINGFPVVVGKTQSLDFDFTVTSAVDTVLFDTLSIWNDCHTKSIIALEVHFVMDKDKPSIITLNDPCKTNYNITVTDSLTWDYGIEEINILSQQNCQITVSDFNSKISTINIKIPDPMQDAYFSIEVTDSIGNKSFYSDSIPGFTITYSLDKDSNDVNYYNFGFNQLGNLICKKFKLTNYGNYDITFDNAELAQNLEFSLPQSQFPFIIKSKETKDLTACFYPIKVTKEPNRDTLKLFFKCLLKDIVLVGNSDTLILKGEDKCSSSIKLYTTKIPYDYFIDGIYPNPAMSIIKVNVGSPEESNLNIAIYDQMGTFIKNLENNMKLSAGIYEITLRVDDLESGLYFLKFNFGTKSDYRKIIINK